MDTPKWWRDHHESEPTRHDDANSVYPTIRDRDAFRKLLAEPSWETLRGYFVLRSRMEGYADPEGMWEQGLIDRDLNPYAYAEIMWQLVEYNPQQRRIRMAKPSRILAQDYADIQNLYAYYNLCSDAGEADGYASCFTRDGELSIPTLEIQIKGRDNLHAFKLRDTAQRGERYRRHWNSGLYLKQLDDRTIRGRCYLQAYNGEPGQPPALADVGVYEDTLVKEDGAWRFAKRMITMDASSFTRPPGA